MKTVTLEDLKSASRKMAFRSLFAELEKEFDDYLKSPGCSICERSLFLKIFENQDKLKDYFGEDVEFDVKIPYSSDSDMFNPSFIVINCNISELDSKLNSIPKTPGTRLDIKVARYEDEVTVIIYQF